MDLRNSTFTSRELTQEVSASSRAVFNFEPMVGLDEVAEGKEREEARALQAMMTPQLVDPFHGMSSKKRIPSVSKCCSSVLLHLQNVREVVQAYLLLA